MTKKRIGVSIISILLILIMIFSFTVTAFAMVKRPTGGYRGRAQQKVNEFNYRDMGEKIRTIEPNWEPLTKNQLRPGQTFVKDPKAKNESSQEGYVIMSVEMPVIVAEQNGTNKYIEQFVINWNTDKFVLLKEGYKKTEKGIRKMYYWGLKKTLVPGEYSSYLFEKVKVNSYTKLLENMEDDIIINTSLFPKTAGYDNISAIFDASGDFYPNDLKDTILELL